MSFLTSVIPRFRGFRRVAELLFFANWGQPSGRVVYLSFLYDDGLQLLDQRRQVVSDYRSQDFEVDVIVAR